MKCLRIQPVEHHTWLFRLFGRGLSGEPLTAFQLGRVLYHAAHLRGFKSNAKERARAEKDKESGKVYGGIKDTRVLMGEDLLPTAFAKLDPEASGQRIRARHTSRDDREKAVRSLLDVQAAHHGALKNPDVRDQVFECIFHQRPLKPVSHFIGRCRLDPSSPRAEMAMPSLQRLRILQLVNDLEVTPPGELPRALDGRERALVRDYLLSGKSLTFTQLRERLGFPAKPRMPKDTKYPRPPFHEFNFERADSDMKLKGDSTTSCLAPILGEQWQTMNLATKDAFVAAILDDDAEDEKEVAENLVHEFGITPEDARKVVEAPLNTDRGSFCAESARTLCAKLDTATDVPARFATVLTELKKARGNAADDSKASVAGFDFLPPYLPSQKDGPAFADSRNDLRNPSILRVLRELRIVVNVLIRKHGKPDRIRIELARDLKKPRGAREEIAKIQKERAGEREKARQQIIEKEYRANPTSTDIDKWLLGCECNWMSPYSGESIPPSRVFAPESDVHIEHIIPRSRSLDNSFANKTLATAADNARKGNRAPHAAFSGDAQLWHEIEVRVSAFAGPGATGKLRRFQWTEEELARRYDDFTARHLHETAWASRLAKDYLSCLFGAENNDGIDADGTRRVETVSGVATGLLRQAWGLSAALLEQSDLPALPPAEEGKPKPGAADKLRNDHRHHAVDAIVVAFTEPQAIRRLSTALQANEDARDFALPPPCENLHAATRDMLAKINVSHRVNRRVAGELHKATYYQPVRASGKRYQRVSLDTFTNTAELERIVDKRIRAAVLEAWNRRTDEKIDPARYFSAANDANLPRIELKNKRDGSTRTVIVRTVTVPIDSITTVPLGDPGEPSRQLHAVTGDNYCVAVVEMPAKTPKGKNSLSFRAITRLDAARKIDARQSAERKKPLRVEELLPAPLAEGERILFTIRSSETLRLRQGKYAGLVYIGTASESGLEGQRLNDSRGAMIRKKMGSDARIRLAPKSLLEAKPEKVILGPLGEVFPCND